MAENPGKSHQHIASQQPQSLLTKVDH